MVAKIDLAQEKLLRKLKAARETWVNRVKDPRSFEEYVNGVADYIGRSPAEVRDSEAARNWAEFQAQADKYVDIWLGNAIKAIERGKWKENYIKAFTSRK